MRKENILQKLLFIFGIGLLIFFSGCGTTKQLKYVDKEVNDIIAANSKVVPGVDEHFVLGDDVRGKPDVYRLASLDNALDLAVKYNRDYRTQRENVYKEALDLGYEKYKWGVIYSGSASTDYSKDLESEEETISYSTDFGFSKMFATGADLSLNLATDFLQYLTGSSRKALASTVTATIIQPLFRGAGKRIAQENIKQAQRDMIYSLRTYARYRKTFSVSIASGYYLILQKKSEVDNQQKNYQNLLITQERMDALAQAGRKSQFEADQVTQQVLTAKDNWNKAQDSYDARLDSFKIELGLSPDAPLEIDPAAWDVLTEEGLKHPGISVENAVKVALENRLDLLTTMDKINDAERDVYVAGDDLKSDIDLSVSYSASTEDKKIADVAWQKGDFTTGLDINLPLDKRSELNILRKAEITLDQTRRSYEEKRESIIENVQGAWRNLKQARQSYLI